MENSKIVDENKTINHYFNMINDESAEEKRRAERGREYVKEQKEKLYARIQNEIKKEMQEKTNDKKKFITSSNLILNLDRENHELIHIYNLFVLLIGIIQFILVCVILSKFSSTNLDQLYKLSIALLSLQVIKMCVNAFINIFGKDVLFIVCLPVSSSFSKWFSWVVQILFLISIAMFYNAIKDAIHNLPPRKFESYFDNVKNYKNFVVGWFLAFFSIEIIIWFFHIYDYFKK
jgi:hypothetical protein